MSARRWLNRALACVACIAVAPHSTQYESSETGSAHASKPSGLSIRFERNMGQWDSRVRFVSRRATATIFITDDAMILASHGGTTVAMHLMGARPSTPEGESVLTTTTNYFSGSDPSKWRTTVPNYARVRMKGWLPGVDVVWHEGPEDVEYDIAVAAGVDANELVLDIDGAESLEVVDGNLEIGTRSGVLLQRVPRVMQRGRELRAHYVVQDGRRVKVAMQDYDRDEAVLIDPVLAYSTYLGGPNGDQAQAVALDAAGNVYVTGFTLSSAFPTQASLQSWAGPAGDYGDVFVSKFDPTGSSLLYSTFIGGSGDDNGTSIAVDSSGNAYVAGWTGSKDFPTKNPLQANNKTCSGYFCFTSFVTKLNATGSALTYSTYLGGTGIDTANAIAVDSSGNVYVAGDAGSSNFPVVNAVQSTAGGSGDAFLAELNPAGSALTYSTYLGGSGVDVAYGVALDASNDAYVTGSTTSTNFPLKSALQPTNSAGTLGTAFISEVAAGGTSLVYSTYLGGSGSESGRAVAVDSAGNAYVVGNTTSMNFPTHLPLQATLGGASDGFVAKLNAGGSALGYATYLGGSATDSALGIALDGKGNAYIAGSSGSADFPTHDAYQPTIGGGNDAFAASLDSTGATLTYATFLGGSADDGAFATTADSSGHQVVVGSTSSTNFPVRAPFQPKSAGGIDAFIVSVIPHLPLGTACSSGDCLSGECVDGVCCDTACTGQCEACDVSGSAGTCTPVTGTPHGMRSACSSTGSCTATCDGTHVAQCTFGPVICASTCSNGTETDGICDSTGACSTEMPHYCKNLTCASEGDGGTCKTTCATTADCLTGFVCEDGGCQTGAVCTDDHTLKGADGTSTDCTPYKCLVGACRNPCQSVDDCIAPSVCDPNGHCVPPSSTSSGCNCDTPGTSAPWYTGLLAVGAASLLTRRRKKAP